MCNVIFSGLLFHCRMSCAFEQCWCSINYNFYNCACDQIIASSLLHLRKQIVFPLSKWRFQRGIGLFKVNWWLKALKSSALQQLNTVLVQNYQAWGLCGSLDLWSGKGWLRQWLYTFCAKFMALNSMCLSYH